jgi:hypothetical protein
MADELPAEIFDHVNRSVRASLVADGKRVCSEEYFGLTVSKRGTAGDPGDSGERDACFARDNYGFFTRL